MYPVRRSARDVLKRLDPEFISALETPTSEPTPSPEPTMTPSPTPAMTPSPKPTEGQRFGYYRILPPDPGLATATPESTTEPQPPTEQQAASESVESGRAFKNIGILALIVVIVIGGIGYLIYRIRA